MTLCFELAINGILVLCPEGQILALATKDTPRFKSWAEGMEFVRKIKAEQEEEHISGEEEYERAKIAILESYLGTVEAENNLIKEVKDKGDEQAVAETQGRFAEVTAKVQQDFSFISEAEKNKVGEIINQQGITVANRLRVCLYWSTDGESFTKFSA